MGAKLNILLFDKTQDQMKDIEFDSTASIYTCGITPYDSSHLGHVSTFLYFDILVRLLESYDIDVTLVRNVTDLDDPLFERVRQSGEDLDVLIAKNISRLNGDLSELNCIRPSYEPYSSHFIKQIIIDIEKLIEKGYAYIVEGWTYFDIRKRPTFPEFNYLKTMDVDELKSMAINRGENLDDTRKKNTYDFVLWKPSAIDEPSFDAPFGSGRPGWHIECSVMALELLGDTIDIHGGGDDLIFPHHACEVAQSESLTDKQFVRHFMHVAPVGYEGSKMSKSLGNLIFVTDVINKIGANATRYYLLSHHYRDGFQYREKDIYKAEAKWSRFAGYLNTSGKPGYFFDEIRNILYNDLDTPRTLALLEQAVSSPESHKQEVIDDISACLELLGFRLQYHH